jgi:hypothetical protein
MTMICSNLLTPAFSRTIAILTLFLFVPSCVHVYVAELSQPGDVQEQLQEEPIITPPEEEPVAPPCALKSQVNSAKQETGSWCWAASAQLVVEYLMKDPVRQCDLVSTVFEDKLRTRAGQPLDPASASQPSEAFANCCDYLTGNPDVGDICEQGGWPDWIFERQRITFQKLDWSSGQTLTWKGVTSQICEDRPFIFVVGWKGGGRHSAVGGGYHTSQNHGNFVEVYDHSPDGFYVMPFQEFQGGRRFTHEFDYVDIQVR